MKNSFSKISKHKSAAQTVKLWLPIDWIDRLEQQAKKLKISANVLAARYIIEGAKENNLH